MIKILKKDIAKYTGSIGQRMTIKPVELKTPADTFILPENILQDASCMAAFPGLSAEAKIQEKDIERKPYNNLAP